MKTYAQMCPLAVGLDKVGDRWTLLILRELLIRKNLRFTDLQKGLPGIATNLLTTRLEELLALDLVSKELVGHGTSQAVYNLTQVGRELEPAIVALAKWGSQFLNPNEKQYVWRTHWLDFARSKKILSPAQVKMALSLMK